jgi:hypothetical protein
MSDFASDVAAMGKVIQEYTAKLLDEHAQALGYVALAWTQLHMTMAEVYAQLLTPGAKRKSLATWHAIRNDRAQRDMLLAVAEVVLKPGDPVLGDKHNGLIWFYNQMDSFENKRNDALHAPYTVIFEGLGLSLVPDYSRGNPRALNLRERTDLAAELKSYRENILALDQHLRLIWGRLSYPPGQRPALPAPPPLPRPAHGGGQKPQNKGE